MNRSLCEFIIILLFLRLTFDGTFSFAKKEKRQSFVGKCRVFEMARYFNLTKKNKKPYIIFQI